MWFYRIFFDPASCAKFIHISLHVSFLLIRKWNSVVGEFSNIPLVVVVSKIPLSTHHIFFANFLGKKTLTELYFYV